MDVNRRGLLAGIGATITATGLGTVSAQQTGTENTTDLPVYFTNVDAEGETVTLVNRGENTVNLGGYVIDWEANNDNYNQDDVLPSNDATTLAPNEELTIASGYNGSTGDVTFGYGMGRINNQDPDVIALRTQNGAVVRRSDESPPEQQPSTPNSDQDSTSTDTGTDQSPDGGNDTGTGQPSQDQQADQSQDQGTAGDSSTGTTTETDTDSDGTTETGSNECPPT